MKNSILGFNQEELIKTNLDMVDLVLLQYIIQACASRKMYHILIDEQTPAVWIRHEKLHSDLPFLGISESTLKNRLTALRKSGFLISETVTANVRGARTYYGITENTENLLYNDITSQKKDGIDDIPSQKKDVIDPSRPKKSTSDNLLTSNTQLEDKVSTNVDTEISGEISSNDTETTSHVSGNRTEGFISKYNRMPQKILTNEKPKKKNLWEKCTDEINRRYTDTTLHVMLVEYLDYRLKSKLHPMGFNGWVGLLNKLDTLGKTDEEKCKIIEQSIKMKWDTFAELKTWGRKSNDKSVFGENDNMRAGAPIQSFRSGVTF